MPLKTDEAVEITQPVILVGVEETEMAGFSKVVLIERRNDLNVSEIHLSGKLSVRMINDTLEVYVNKGEE
jgi:hypothetical protein